MEIDVTPLLGRIDAEFHLFRNRLRALRKPNGANHRDRLERLSLFERACELLREIWEPRLEAVKDRLAQRLKITVLTHSGRRQAGLAFTSTRARIKMTFTAMTDTDVRGLDLEYALDVLPSFMSFPGRDRFEQRFESLDARALEKWIDNRIVEFVRTYLSLYENEYYFSGHIVEDPVAHVRFPKCAAASTLEHQGETLYFIANETRDELEASACHSLIGARGA